MCRVDSPLEKGMALQLSFFFSNKQTIQIIVLLNHKQQYEKETIVHHYSFIYAFIKMSLASKK